MSIFLVVVLFMKVLMYWHGTLSVFVLSVSLHDNMLLSWGQGFTWHHRDFLVISCWSKILNGLDVWKILKYWPLKYFEILLMTSNIIKPLFLWLWNQDPCDWWCYRQSQTGSQTKWVLVQNKFVGMNQYDLPITSKIWHKSNMHTDIGNMWPVLFGKLNRGFVKK